jgi:hypothetical protein
MPEPWDSLSPEAQAEIEGYVSYACNTGGEFRDALISSTAQAYASMGDAYQGFLTGRNMPPTPTPVTMETTTSTSEPLTAAPSYSAALLQAGAAAGREQEAEHWRDYANDHAEEDRQHSIVYPHEVGEDGAAPARGAAPAQDSSASSYGVEPPASPTQPSEEASPSPTTPTQEPDAYEPDL